MLPTRTELEDLIRSSDTWVKISIDSGRKKSIGYVLDILTKAETHPHGIMVEIHTGEKGRVERLSSEEEIKEYQSKSAEKISGIVNEFKNNQEENLMTEFKSTFRFDTKLEIFKKQGKNKR